MPPMEDYERRYPPSPEAFDEAHREPPVLPVYFLLFTVYSMTTMPDHSPNPAALTEARRFALSTVYCLLSA